MPKAKPDQVVVHRIELQEKERELIQAYVGATVAKNVVVPTALVVGVGSAAYIGYKATKAAFGWTEDIVGDMKDLVQEKIMEPVLGKDTYTNEKTGQTFKNPLAGIPVLGSLFGSGINIGIATTNAARENSEQQAARRAQREQEMNEASGGQGHPAYSNYGEQKTYESREEMYGV